MAVRVGVDVGGTFTKAVAVDLEAGIVAQAVLPTTHDAAEGVAAGVVQCVADVAAQVGADQIDLVTHSTTQAVNALLEGDVGTVGIIGMGRRPELAQGPQAHRAVEGRARAGQAPRHAAGVPRRHRRPGRGRDRGRASSASRDRGVSAIAPPRRSLPTTRRTRHESRRWPPSSACPSCASTRAVRAVRARAAHGHRRDQRVDHADRAAHRRATSRRAWPPPASTRRSWSCGATAARPTSTASGRRRPARSTRARRRRWPGALRYTGVRDGVVVEVGGTSTNVAAIQRGPPVALLRHRWRATRPRCAPSTCG